MLEKRLASLLVMGTVASFVGSAFGEDYCLLDKPLLLMADPSTAPSSPGQASEKDVAAINTPAPAPAAPNIHGFANVEFKTAYVTPRGLVVQNAGVNIQPVAGLVLPIGDVGVFKKFALVTGIWNSITSAQGDTDVGPWNEMDFFFSMNSTVADNFGLSLTYGAWNFPNSTVAKPSTEHNIDLKISYDDSKLWGSSGFALNPYADIFWAVGGSSTVVLGRQGDTGYVELGIAPSYTCKAIADYPISFTFPTYFSVGPEHYWGAGESGGDPDGNFGVFSTAVSASAPMAFIPTTYGNWHADVGLSYFYLMNDNLLNAGRILSGNDDRNVFVISAGVGVSF